MSIVDNTNCEVRICFLEYAFDQPIQPQGDVEGDESGLSCEPLLFQGRSRSGREQILKISKIEANGVAASKKATKKVTNRASLALVPADFLRPFSGGLSNLKHQSAVSCFTTPSTLPQVWARVQEPLSPVNLDRQSLLD